MTGRIKLISSDGAMMSETNTPAIPYDYDFVSSFDQSCGTYDIERFQTSKNPHCPDFFVCNDGAGAVGAMAECINAMDCAMLAGMTVYYGDEGKDSKINDTILFLRGMIPHHQNAVNMAKNLLKSGEVDCNVEGSEEDVSVACLLEPIVRSIINTQNMQIQAMQGLLENFNVPVEKQCDVETSDASVVSSLNGVLPVAFLMGLFL